LGSRDGGHDSPADKVREPRLVELKGIDRAQRYIALVSAAPAELR